jgi:hypothetical protein
MIDERFVLLAALFNLVGGSSYLLATIKGRVRPNRVTWFIWSLAPLIAFVAEVLQGVGLRSLMTFMVGFMPLLIFIASFLNKKAYWKLTNFDFFCGFLSIIGLVLWGITRIGDLAIFFSILSDALASVPTLTKAYFHPETEDWKIFLFAGISAFITLLTVKAWDFAHFGFPVYILINCLTFIFLLKFRT